MNKMKSQIIDGLRIDGIPCKAMISIHKAYRGHRENGIQMEPDEPAGWDLEEVLDRKGYSASWLEKKLVGQVEENFMMDIDEKYQSDLAAEKEYQEERRWDERNER